MTHVNFDVTKLKNDTIYLCVFGTMFDCILQMHELSNKSINNYYRYSYLLKIVNEINSISFKTYFQLSIWKCYTKQKCTSAHNTFGNSFYVDIWRLDAWRMLCIPVLLPPFDTLGCIDVSSPPSNASFVGLEHFFSRFWILTSCAWIFSSRRAIFLSYFLLSSPFSSRQFY